MQSTNKLRRKYEQAIAICYIAGITRRRNGKCIYHRVMRNENFEKAANDLYDLLIETQKKYPDSSRLLYLDIDGHRNSNGGFDKDMLEFLAIILM